MRGYTVYWNPRDHPGRVVVRGFELVEGAVVADPAPVFVGYPVARARAEIAAIDPSLFRFPRNPDDDPVIVECWL